MADATYTVYIRYTGYRETREGSGGRRGPLHCAVVSAENAVARILEATPEPAIAALVDTPEVEPVRQFMGRICAAAQKAFQKTRGVVEVEGERQTFTVRVVRDGKEA